jgi:hypothetical protein
MPKPQYFATSTAADQPTDRQADSRCLSLLRRKTSKLKGEPTKGSKKSHAIVKIRPDLMTFSAAAFIAIKIYALEHCSEKPICNIILHNLFCVKYTSALGSCSDKPIGNIILHDLFRVLAQTESGFCWKHYFHDLFRVLAQTESGFCWKHYFTRFISSFSSN